MSEPVCVLRGLVEAPRETVPPAPIATKKFVLADGAPWTEVGVGPLMMMSRHIVMYVIADEPPDASPVDGFRLEPRVTQTINLASRVWAASSTTGGAELIVAGSVK